MVVMLIFWFGGMAFEVGRKILTPEEEKPTEDMYSKIIGAPNSALITTLFALLSSLAFGWFTYLVHPIPILNTIALLVVVPMLLLTLKLYRKVEKRTIKFFELSTLIAYLAVEIILISYLYFNH